MIFLGFKKCPLFLKFNFFPYTFNNFILRLLNSPPSNFYAYVSTMKNGNHGEWECRSRRHNHADPTENGCRRRGADGLLTIVKESPTNPDKVPDAITISNKPDLSVLQPGRNKPLDDFFYINECCSTGQNDHLIAMMEVEKRYKFTPSEIISYRSELDAAAGTSICKNLSFLDTINADWRYRVARWMLSVRNL